jgi:hypothetical protein
MLRFDAFVLHFDRYLWAKKIKAKFRKLTVTAKKEVAKTFQLIWKPRRFHIMANFSEIKKKFLQSFAKKVSQFAKWMWCNSLLHEIKFSQNMFEKWFVKWPKAYIFK